MFYVPTGGPRTDAIKKKRLTLYIVFILLHVLHITPSVMWRGEFTLSVIFLTTSVRDVVPIVCGRFPDGRRHTPTGKRVITRGRMDGFGRNKRYGASVRFDRYRAEEFPWRSDYKGVETGKGREKETSENPAKTYVTYANPSHTQSFSRIDVILPSSVATINPLERNVAVHVSTGTNRKIDR